MPDTEKRSPNLLGDRPTWFYRVSAVDMELRLDGARGGPPATTEIMQIMWRAAQEIDAILQTYPVSTGPKEA